MLQKLSSVKVVGSGLIGTSIALSLKNHGLTVQMQDRDPKSEHLANDLVGGVEIKHPDLIVISASIEANLDLILESLKINPESIVMDVGSVKSNLLDEVSKLSENAENFISSHPMAGREVSGAESARSDLFQGRAWLGINSEFSSDQARQYLTEVVNICGGTLYWLTAKEHDDAVAAISHLPQILSTSLAYTLADLDTSTLNLAGQGLRDLLRLSGSNPKLWSELLLANKRSLAIYLEEMSKTLSTFQKSLLEDDQVMLENIFKSGNDLYAKLPGKHGGQLRNYAYLPIVIDDQPGQLAKIFDECAKIKVNIEDLSIEHSPGQQTGLITLALNEKDALELSKHLQNVGWNVHSLKVDK